MANLGTIGVHALVAELANTEWDDDRLDPALDGDIPAVGIFDYVAAAGYRAGPWNQTGAGSGQPVIGASIQIA